MTKEVGCVGKRLHWAPWWKEDRKDRLHEEEISDSIERNRLGARGRERGLEK